MLPKVRRQSSAGARVERGARAWASLMRPSSSSVGTRACKRCIRRERQEREEGREGGKEGGKEGWREGAKEIEVTSRYTEMDQLW